MTECPLLPWMRSKKFTQVEVAELLKAPQTSVSKYIRGERGFRLPRFQKLAAVTGIPLGDLVAWSADAQRRSRRTR